MRPSVYILATCRKRELIDKTLLVFDSLRTGFPTATVLVTGNDLDPCSEQRVAEATARIGGNFRNLKATTHGGWIEALLNAEDAPFWICDTDIVFHAGVEHWFDRPGVNQLFAGRYEPEFRSDWLQATHAARLHPSLMWFQPRALRAAMRAWPGKDPCFNAVEKVLIRWTFIPQGERLLFYDTCAGLHQALGGVWFTKAQNECFTHCFCGTYSDLACLAGITEGSLREHEALCKSLSPD